MREISKEDLYSLKKYLVKKPFEHEEVFYEVLDHYVSAYEHSESSLAEVKAELDVEFTNERIIQIDRDYVKSLRRQIWRAFGSALLSFFRWPQIVSSLLFVILIGLLGPFLIQEETLTGVLFFGALLVPMMINGFGLFSYTTRDPDYPGGFKNALASAASVLNTGNLLLFNSCLWIQKYYSLWDFHPLVSSLIVILAVWLSLSAVKVYKAKFEVVLG